MKGFQQNPALLSQSSPSWSFLYRRTSKQIIAICFCMVSQTWMSLNCSGFRIDWLSLWESLLHLLAVFHYFVPFTGYQLHLEYCSRSDWWSTKLFMKNSLSIFTPCLLCHSCPIREDQTKELVCRSPESRPIQVLEHSTLVHLLFGTLCPFSHYSCCLQKTSEDTSVWPSLSPILISMSDDLLML